MSTDQVGTGPRVEPGLRPAAPVAPHPLLGGRSDDPALITADGSLSYGELARLVGRRREELGPVRRLVLLEAGNDIESIVTYLAALEGQHPVLLVAPGDVGRRADYVERYDPDVLHTTSEGRLREVRPGTRHELHPELALLLSTSGSTGSPKLVRLSRANVVANASSIATYLDINPDDRAITTLPMHYCYGLSVLNSHLLGGAGVVLTDLSVADECFWDLAAEAEVTTLAGVPYTFDLLEAAGFRDRDLPSLRCLTQAGGRMDPGRVRAYAELGRSRGWSLVVMYGQTEATARMAYLPPHLAADRPEAIGIPIPGGNFHLERPHEGGADLDPGVGELVYEGPNVMMGYAEHPGELADGAVHGELRTGDLARQSDDGLWEIVGRINRVAKVFGLRVDLERLEADLAATDCRAWIVAGPDQLWAFTDQPRRRETITRLLRDRTQLPAGAVRVVAIDRLPQTSSGKPDRAALTRHVEEARSLEQTAGGGSASGAVAPTAAAVRDLYAVVLGRPEATTADSFIGLGGDSLSYVEVSLRLGSMLGDLPTGWPQLSPEQLVAAPVRHPRRLRTVPIDMSVALRAVATVLILVAHADLAQLQGGAHVLLALVGYNLARFHLQIPGRAARGRAILRSAWSVAVPAALWITAVIMVAGTYRWQTAVLLNGPTGSESWTVDWQFWFLESLVWTYLVAAALVSVPVFDRWQRARPFAAAFAVLLVLLSLRYALVGVEAESVERYSTGAVLWCVALGWAAAVARTRRQQLLVAAAAVVATVGFFDDPRREVFVLAGVLLLLLVDRPLHLPRPLVVLVHVVAGASLWIYLTQWQVYPGLEDAGHPVLAVLASVLVGVLCLEVYRLVGSHVGRLWTVLRPASS